MIGGYGSQGVCKTGFLKRGRLWKWYTDCMTTLILIIINQLLLSSAKSPELYTLKQSLNNVHKHLIKRST